jgi:hypothetical protein
MMKLQKLSRAEHNRLNQEARLRLHRHAVARKAAGVKPNRPGLLKGKLIVVGDHRKVFNLD